MLVKLSEICLIEKGQQIDTDKLDDSYQFKYINGGIKESGHFDKYNTEGNTITVSEGGASCGHVNFVEDPFWCGCHCYRLTKAKVNIKYLYFALKANERKIMDLRTGVAMPNIKKSSFADLLLKIDFSLQNQAKVVATLEKIAALINFSLKELSIMDELTKSRFIEMFGNKINSSNYFCKFGDISDSIIGLTYSPDNIVKEGNKGTIVLRSGNIQNGSLQIVNDVVRVTNIKINDNKFVRNNDILMCSRNGSSRLVGKTCLITNPIGQMSFGAFMTIIRTPYPYIVNTYMNLPYFREQLIKTQTASVNQITNGMLKDLQIFKPTELDESLFKIFVEQVDKLKFI